MPFIWPDPTLTLKVIHLVSIYDAELSGKRLNVLRSAPLSTPTRCISHLRVTTVKDPSAASGVQPMKPSSWKRPPSSSRSSSRPAASLKLYVASGPAGGTYLHRDQHCLKVPIILGQGHTTGKCASVNITGH